MSKNAKSKGGEKRMELDTLYTKEDILRRYDLVSGTLNNWVSKGKIPYVKIGKKVLFPARELERWEKKSFHAVNTSPIVNESERK